MLKRLPKEKQIKKLEEQDKILAGLPDPKKEQKLLKRMGQRLKRMIKPKKVDKSKVKKIEKEVEEAHREAEREKRMKG